MFCFREHTNGPKEHQYVDSSYFPCVLTSSGAIANPDSKIVYYYTRIFLCCIKPQWARVGWRVISRFIQNWI